MSIQKITPFLWLDSQAEEAVNFYTSVFKNSRVLSIGRYDEHGAKASGRPEGSVMVSSFELEGQQFTALNGGPMFKFSGAISFIINCENQEEVDYYWERLSDGGESGQCGWINRDKFGITWQVVPIILEKLLSDPDHKKSGNVMHAMLKMNKIIIKDLQEAYDKE
jgi:predicted 3-demethylubiquinone-9 3-methyltransferase (glyoxalase superfamily)